MAGQVLGSIWCTGLALWPAVVFLAVCGYTPPTCLQDPCAEWPELLGVAILLALTAGQRCNDNSLVVSAGIPTYAVREDLEDRGISQNEIAQGVTLVSRSGVADLYDSHDAIWHW